MAMLAEPRRKQKWSVDPRNSAWSKDDSKFGQKMLERMGWSKGKGLGKSEQGATEHVKVKVKNNSLGLGTTVSHEDNWIAHQDDFNQLLAELNSCHGRSNSNEPEQEQTQSFSLEKKSKVSKKRVHYMKFTKGKDLSSRSETDLACVFGRRSKQSREQEEGSDGPDSQEEKKPDGEEEELTRDKCPEPEVETNTVTSSLTMQEYFAQRMAQLKRGRTEGPSPAGTPALTPAQSLCATPASTEDSQDATDVEHQTKKKKKKKRERLNAEEADNDQVDAVSVAKEESVSSEESRRKRKKNKKNKGKHAQEVEEVRVEESSLPTIMDDNCQNTDDLNTGKKKKKTKKCKLNELTAEIDLVNGHDTSENMVEDSDVSHKKKKKRKRREEEEDEAADEDHSKDQKKKKKKHTN